MLKTLFLIGHSDKQLEEIYRESRRQGKVVLPEGFQGVTPIMPYVTSDQTLAANSVTMALGIHGIDKMSSDTPFNLFNLVGDADSSGRSLHNIQSIGNQIRPQRFFNQPVHVFKTSRECLPETLRDIPGCVVPRVRSAHPGSFEELLSVCVEFDSWPVILRARGLHGGQQMLLVNDSSELEAHRGVTWLYDDIVLIQFFDYRDSDGMYQKNRVAMIDGRPYIRHAIFSDRWSVHTECRIRLMDSNPELRRREEVFLAQFRDRDLQRYAPVLEQIQQRIGLDVYGVDFALVNDKILVFEANACMSFVGQRHGTDDQYGYLDDYLQAIRQALKDMLVKG